MNDNGPEHIGSIEPDPERHQRLEFTDSENGHRFAVDDMFEDPDNPDTASSAVYEYDSDGNFVDRHEVITPKRLTEAKRVALEFTERHKKSLAIGATTILVLISVGTLVVRRRKN